MELCLGTVQFGMDYGIKGQKQPSVEQAVDMLDYATQNGINTIDTDKLFIVSKFRPNLLDDVGQDKYYEIMRNNLENTLSRLHTDYLDSYLLHSARYIFDDEIIDTLNRLKADGLAKRVGVSVYEPEEAKKCIERPNVDFMQLPYSIFDQRMEKAGVFENAKKDSIQIHSRSAFIQGLILMEEDEVPPFLAKAKPIVKKISLLCERHGLSKISLAMNYVKQQSRISHLVFGVDNLEQLKEDIEIFSEDISTDIIDDIAKEFTDIEADIVMPSLWKK